MFRTNFKNLTSLLFAFSVQNKGRKNYINIGKLIKKEQQASINASNFSQKKTFIKRPYQKIEQNVNLGLDMQQQNWNPKTQQKHQHVSTQQQQMNHKIKTAIRCETLYYECSRKKHKLELRQYALMFAKILELRKMNSSQRKQTQDFVNFLTILNKKMEEMPPEELVKIIYSIKQERVSQQDMKQMLPLVQKIIDEFSNIQNDGLQPKSFETLRLSTTIKLFYSLLYVLENSGSHFDKKLKFLMNETLNYILFRSMKTKKHSKSGEYFPLNLKITFLNSCKAIEASNTCIKNLILSILVQKDKLTLQTLFLLERTVFENIQILEKTRKQLFTEKDIHIKYNILYRIEKYINDLIPLNLKKSSNYALVDKNLAVHLNYLNQLTFDEVNIMEMSTLKDDHQSKILSLFHQAYKNSLIENYSSINEKDDIVAFFKQNQLSKYSLFQLLSFFYNKLKIDNGASLKPSIKKELKQFISLLCKFYPKLNFLTQSIIIDILAISNYSNLKPILTEFLEINTYLNSEKNLQKPHFMRKDKLLMIDHFFTIIKHQNIFIEHCSSQYQLFINSNLKIVLKQIFKSTHYINIEKFTSYLGQYCKTLTQQSLKQFMQNIINIYMKHSLLNRSFKKGDVDIIFKNKDYFLSNDLKSFPQIQNQADIFGEDIAQKQQKQMNFIQKILPTLQNDQQLFREHYKIQQKIRIKLRMALKNFRFIILLLENVKLNVSYQTYEKIINENQITTLLMNFKSEIECLKFQRLITKQNCSDINEIHDLLGEIWSKTFPKVQVRNEMLMHQHQSANQKVQIKIEKESQKEKIANIQQNTVKPKQKEQAQIFDQQEQESQQSEYTEQIQYLQGKDFYQLQTFKEYKQKQDKNTLYFFAKNKEIFQEMSKLTNNFTELPNNSSEKQINTQLLKYIQLFYSSFLNSQQNQRKIIDLPTVDDNKIAKQNFDELISISIQNRQNKSIYNLRVFQKLYPAFAHFSSLQRKQENEIKNKGLLSKVFYVNISKIKKNYKKKKVQVIQQQKNEVNNQVKSQEQEEKTRS